MELPENTTDRFKLPLDMDNITAWGNYWDTPATYGPSTPKLGEFRWNGKHFAFHDEERTTAREYVLIHIT